MVLRAGKTLVFMKLIDEVYQQGKGVIVMVPEISLTPQTIGRFHKRYGNRVAVFHSALSMENGWMNGSVLKWAGSNCSRYSFRCICSI